MIEGVLLTPLKKIDVPKGDVYHGIKASDPGYEGFGEAYFSTVRCGAVKAWKKHKRMTLNLVVPVGKIVFVIFDDRDASGTNGRFAQFALSLDNYNRLTIPPGLWLGFKGVGEDTNLLLNLANIEHELEEGVKRSMNEIVFDWSTLE